MSSDDTRVIVFDGHYRLLARNRYRWFGRREVCYLPERH
jgi:predicted DCC family thiol-disulfide oxidoreductase YuxK